MILSRIGNVDEGESRGKGEEVTVTVRELEDLESTRSHRSHHEMSLCNPTKT